MIETLISVGVGGLIGVGGTIATTAMQNRKERELQLRKEVLPITARALAAAHEAWDSARQSRDSSIATDGYRNILRRNAEARNQLLIALDELALLIPDIEDETLDLLESTSSETWAKNPDQRLDDYLDATTALQERVRAILKTKK